MCDGSYSSGFYGGGQIVPLGFWLPVGLKRFRSLLKTGLTGLAVTFLVEVLQIVTRRGIFEFDDILNNLAGTLIGYGFFALAYWLFIEKSKKKTVLKMADCQLPLVLCLTVIAVVCSKSFYQPVYLFDGTVNGQEYQIRIPAVK